MFTGTLANALAIVVGSLIGTLLHSRFPPRIQSIVFHGLGLTTLLIGLKMAWDCENIIAVVISLVAGGAVGELLRLEDRLHQLGGCFASAQWPSWARSINVGGGVGAVLSVATISEW